MDHRHCEKPFRIEIGDKDPKRFFTMSVVPTTWRAEQIKLSFNIEDKGFFNFRAQPQIVVHPDQKGTISITTDSGKILELRTVANLHNR